MPASKGLSEQEQKDGFEFRAILGEVTARLISSPQGLKHRVLNVRSF
jgi:hypothetical protein